MSAAHEHRSTAPLVVRCAVLTVSDSRTPATDVGGDLLAGGLSGAGHAVVARAILKDDPAAVRTKVAELLDRGEAQAVLTTGGTGITARDSTFEAIDGLLDKRLTGFGELFRFLSYAEIGAAAMLSRATAGTARGGVVIALPGSPDAVRLALEKLILPELAHMVALARK